MGWLRGGYFWKGESKYCLGRAKKLPGQIVRFRDDFEGLMTQMMRGFLAGDAKKKEGIKGFVLFAKHRRGLCTIKTKDAVFLRFMAKCEGRGVSW